MLEWVEKVEAERGALEVLVARKDLRSAVWAEKFLNAVDAKDAPA